MRLSRIRTDLAPDEPLIQDADYRFDEFDRALIDEQIRASQEHLAAALLNGIVATYVRLDGASDSIAPGDGVCLTAALLALPTVTKALPAALLAAGAVLGLALRPAPPGSHVLVALAGCLPTSVTGLTSQNGPRFIRCGANARSERVAKFAAGDFPLGAATNAGALTLTLLPQVAALLP
jgi:hypothetical protein